MKQLRVLQRLLSLVLATLLLFMAVWGNHSVAQAKTLLVNKAAAEHAKPSKTSAPKEAKLSATQFEAVVTPAIQLGDSGQTAFLLPVSTLVILLLISILLLRHFTLPHFYFSYFRHVFGHHIATNAP
jgi:hypothetical protein